MKRIVLGLLLALVSIGVQAATVTATWSAYTAPTGVTATLHLYCGIGAGAQSDIGNVASTAVTMTATIASTSGQLVSCNLHAVAPGYNDGISLAGTGTTPTLTLAAPTGFAVTVGP